MAISVDWATRVITVPRADLLEIQLIPSEIRQLDLDAFRSELNDISDDSEGMPFPDTHSHNTTVTVGGVTLARVVEIINGYTVTFEDGLYAVNLVGANSNVADVTNVNFVSIRAANSAGLIQVTSGSGVLPSDIVDIKNAVWDASALSHTIVGSMGWVLSFIRKLLGNRAVVAGDDSTTTIYDDDKVTPILTHDHPSSRERDPQ